MELLPTKIIALTLMGALSLFFGLLPLRLRKCLNNGPSKKRDRITSYLLCFGGGVLLATVFIHMVPETRENFMGAFNLGVLTAGRDYPLAELLICAGFFLIYMVEELVHKLTKDTTTHKHRHRHHRHHHHHHHHHHLHHNGHKLENMEIAKQTPTRESGRISVYSIMEAVKKGICEDGGKGTSSPEAPLSPKDKKWAESGVDNPVFAGDGDATSWTTDRKDPFVTGSQVSPSESQPSALTSDSMVTLQGSLVSADTHKANGVPNNNYPHNGTHGTSSNGGANGTQANLCEGPEANNNQKDQEKGHGHSHLELNKLCAKGISGNLRMVIILLALSIHSIFEGLAVGLQEKIVDVWYLFGAVAAHKFVIAFCMGIKFLATLPVGLMVIYMVVLALVSPLGMAIGIIITETASSSDQSNHLLLITILQGLAGGTILYVTFFEILERERGKEGGRLFKFFFMLVGFAIMASMEAIGGHSHGHVGGGHEGHDHGSSHAGHIHAHHNHGHSDDLNHRGEHFDHIVNATKTLPKFAENDHNHSDHGHEQDALEDHFLGEHDGHIHGNHGNYAIEHADGHDHNEEFDTHDHGEHGAHDHEQGAHDHKHDSHDHGESDAHDHEEHDHHNNEEFDNHNHGEHGSHDHEHGSHDHEHGSHDHEDHGGPNHMDVQPLLSNEDIVHNHGQDNHFHDHTDIDEHNHSDISTNNHDSHHPEPHDNHDHDDHSNNDNHNHENTGDNSNFEDTTNHFNSQDSRNNHNNDGHHHGESDTSEPHESLNHAEIHDHAHPESNNSSLVVETDFKAQEEINNDQVISNNSNHQLDNDQLLNQNSTEQKIELLSDKFHQNENSHIVKIPQSSAGLERVVIPSENEDHSSHHDPHHSHDHDHDHDHDHSHDSAHNHDHSHDHDHNHDHIH